MAGGGVAGSDQADGRERWYLILLAGFPHQPLPYYFKHILLFFRGEFTPLGDAVPLLQAATAAAPCGVLGYEHRMILHGGLLAVVGYFGGEQAGLEQILRMLHYCIKPLLVKIRQLPPA